MAISSRTARVMDFIKTVVEEEADALGYKRPYLFAEEEREHGVRMEMSDSTLPIPNMWGTKIDISI